MSALRRFMDHPRQVSFRWWMFQIHLWSGVAVALYGVVIGLTGSVLVYAPEIRDWQDRAVIRVSSSGTRVSPDAVLASVHAANPDGHVMTIRMPTEERGTYQLSTGHMMGMGHEVFVDPFTARIVAEREAPAGALKWVQQLHFNLLTGKTGRLVNGVGALLLVLLSLTGLVVWWPGRAYWARAVTIKWSAGWKRINYDVHSAVGLFGLVFVVIISITGAYFTWTPQTKAAIARVSPTPNQRPAPKLAPRDGDAGPLPVSELMRRAGALVPDAWVASVMLPHGADQPVKVVLMQGGPKNFQNTNAVYLDPRSGEVVRADLVSTRTWGDAVIGWIPVLHFGFFSGQIVKFLWALFGLSPLVLGVSGLLMWWNRVLVKKVWWWKRVSSKERAPAWSLNRA